MFEQLLALLVSMHDKQVMIYLGLAKLQQLELWWSSECTFHACPAVLSGTCH